MLRQCQPDFAGHGDFEGGLILLAYGVVEFTARETGAKRGDTARSTPSPSVEFQPPAWVSVFTIEGLLAHRLPDEGKRGICAALLGA